MSAGSEAKPSERDWAEFNLQNIIMCGRCGWYYRRYAEEKTNCPKCNNTERAGYEFIRETRDGFLVISPAMLDQLMGAANRGR